MRLQRLRLCALVLFVGGCAAHVPFSVTPIITPSVLIHDTAVLDVETGTVAAPRDVLIVDGFIAEITPPGHAVKPPQVTEMSGHGATVVPGLIDVHAHLGGSSAPPWAGGAPDATQNMRAYLYCGVTTVLDAAGLLSDSFVRRDKVNNGFYLGPHIYAAGPMITAPGGHPVALLRATTPWWARWYVIPGLALEVDGPDAARAAVNQIAEAGADFIKIVVDSLPAGAPRISRAALRAAVEEAHSRGLRIVAHIGSIQDALDAGEAGVDAWMHPVYKERIPDALLATFARFRIPMVSTLGVFDSYAKLGVARRETTALERETVDAGVLESLNHVPSSARSGVLGSELAELRSYAGVWSDNVRRLHRSGVTILAGSDSQMGVFPGAGLQRELQLLTEAGFSPAQAIRAATVDNASFLVNSKTPPFGRIAIGQRADVLVVDGDPTQDISALSRVRAVIKSGIIIDRHTGEAGAL
jgi:imidazolonepropionase-like amidohydrolase